MATYNGFMNIYNGFGGTISNVKAVHTTSKGTTNELNIPSLAQGLAATATSLVAFDDQEDNWTLEFTDDKGFKKTVGFDDAGFEEEDIGGTVVYNISPSAVKLCFPQSGDELEEF